MNAVRILIRAAGWTRVILGSGKPLVGEYSRIRDDSVLVADRAPAGRPEDQADDGMSCLLILA